MRPLNLQGDVMKWLLQRDDDPSLVPVWPPDEGELLVALCDSRLDADAPHALFLVEDEEDTVKLLATMNDFHLAFFRVDDRYIQT